MKINKHTVSNDPLVYEAWPDVTLTKSGKLVCVFAECTSHLDRTETGIVLVDSADRGRSWSLKRQLTESTAGLNYYYNCPRISTLQDGRLCVMIDRISHSPDGFEGQDTVSTAVNLMYFSDDEGISWSEPVQTPLRGIVPDKLRELDCGRWLIAAHRPVAGKLAQFMHYSDDQGRSWSDPVVIAQDSEWNLCEASILPLGNATLVAFMRENSGSGMDCIKSVSYDNGETWGPLVRMPIPACHRPVAAMLADGKILITYRMLQGGSSWGYVMQNFLMAVTDRASALATVRDDAEVRIIPLDYDRSCNSDLGYSGHVQFADGEVYVVNYIVDDAVDKAQIRGYSFSPSVLEPFRTKQQDKLVFNKTGVVDEMCFA